MKINGSIHLFPKEIKIAIAAFVFTLSIGFYTGLLFVNETSNFTPDGIEQNYNGNEEDENAIEMKFKKSEREILTVIHNHILSMSIIFFMLSLLLATTSINKKLKYFLMIEPFLSIIVTFGGIYIIWIGISWFKYVVMISGMFMTLSFVASTLIIFQQLLVKKIKDS